MGAVWYLPKCCVQFVTAINGILIILSNLNLKETYFYRLSQQVQLCQIEPMHISFHWLQKHNHQQLHIFDLLWALCAGQHLCMFRYDNKSVFNANNKCISAIAWSVLQKYHIWLYECHGWLWDDRFTFWWGFWLEDHPTY